MSGEKGLGGITKLMHAASLIDDSEELSYLLDVTKEGIDDQDDDGWTALHYAASRGFSRNVAMLDKAGAYPFSRNNDKKTPLDLAIKGGHVETSVLLEKAEQAAPLIKPEDLPAHVVELERIVEEQRAAMLELKAEILALKDALPKKREFHTPNYSGHPPDGP